MTKRKLIWLEDLPNDYLELSERLSTLVDVVFVKNFQEFRTAVNNCNHEDVAAFCIDVLIKGEFNLSDVGVSGVGTESQSKAGEQLVYHYIKNKKDKRPKTEPAWIQDIPVLILTSYSNMQAIQSRFDPNDDVEFIKKFTPMGSKEWEDRVFNWTREISSSR